MHRSYVNTLHYKSNIYCCVQYIYNNSSLRLLDEDDLGQHLPPLFGVPGGGGPGPRGGGCLGGVAGPLGLGLGGVRGRGAPNLSHAHQPCGRRPGWITASAIRLSRRYRRSPTAPGCGHGLANTV